MSAKIILISGYCATGKSTFSQILSEKIHIPSLNKDTLKECLGDNIGSEQTSTIPKLSTTTVSLMIFMAEELLKANVNFILEANFKEHEIEKLRNLINKYKSECLTYLFKGDLQTLYKRYIERDQIRHWVHTACTVSVDEFIDSQKTLGEIKIGKMINVDSTIFSNVDYDYLICQAQDFLENNQ